MQQVMREDCSYIYPPLSIARYSFIQLCELEQCRVTTRAQGFNIAAQDSNPGPLSRESEALPMSHCAIYLADDIWNNRHTPKCTYRGGITFITLSKNN